jgi:hypothetical protein
MRRCDNIEHLIGRDLQPGGDFAGLWRTIEVLGQLGHNVLDRLSEVFKASGDPHRPGLVTKVSAHFAGDARYRERQEVVSTVRIEPVDRVNQPDAGDLLEVLQWFASVGVASRNVPGDGRVAHDEPPP